MRRGNLEIKTRAVKLLGYEFLNKDMSLIKCWVSAAFFIQTLKQGLIKAPYGLFVPNGAHLGSFKVKPEEFMYVEKISKLNFNKFNCH